MALSRRTGQRFQASIWPGFVDAMTGLLLVLMFVLTIFMVVQFVLRETISGQEAELSDLSSEISALSQALGIEQNRSASLDTQVADLTRALGDVRAERASQEGLVAALRASSAAQEVALEQAQAQITGFESQVAALLADRDAAVDRIRGLEGEAAGLETALAAARDEIDAEAEAARLAAAQREAVEALLAEARAEAEARGAQLADAQAALSAEETARLAGAAALEALRARFEGAEAELTAMSLALDEQRREAEETLTLLAAARGAREAALADLATAVAARQAAEGQAGDADASRAEAEALAEERAQELAAAQQDLAALAAELAAQRDAGGAALTEAERQAGLLAIAQERLGEAEALSERSQRQVEALNQQVAELRAQVRRLSGLLGDAEDAEAAAMGEVVSLGGRLNEALARAALAEQDKVAAEQARAEALAREAEALAREKARLEAEAVDLARYRSEFFGAVREVLEGQDGVRIVGDRFVFSSEVLFAPGQAVLSRAGRAQIAQIAGTLRSLSDRIPEGVDWVLRVDGHTDAVPLSGEGEFRDNWELSQARALSVVRYMASDLGFPPERLAANGFGEFQPIAEGDSPEALAANRRIELKLTER